MSKYEKTDNEWHEWIAGQLKCLWCNYGWTAVYRDDARTLVCPKCGLRNDVTLLEDNGPTGEGISA